MITGLLTLLGVAMQASPSPPGVSFCARMAEAMEMKPMKETGVWQLQTLGGLGAALFGGTSTMALAVRPVGNITQEELDRLDKSCEATSKGAFCNIEGPLEFRVKTRKGDATLIAEPKDRARVEITGTRIRCTDIS